MNKGTPQMCVTGITLIQSLTNPVVILLQPADIGQAKTLLGRNWRNSTALHAHNREHMIYMLDNMTFIPLAACRCEVTFVHTLLINWMLGIKNSCTSNPLVGPLWTCHGRYRYS